MIGVAGRDEAEVFQEWIEGREVTGFDHIADPDTVVWREFDVTTQPAFVFINDDGEVERHLGPLGLDSLTERVNDLIAR